jgi:hypothetical protein
LAPAETLRLTLLRSENDAVSFSPTYQAELRQFFQLVRADGTRLSAVALTMDSVGAGGGFMGEFVIPLAQVIGPVLGGAAVAWLQGRAGRRSRLKVGDIEAEANMQAGFDALLAKAIALWASEPVPELDHE